MFGITVKICEDYQEGCECRACRTTYASRVLRSSPYLFKKYVTKFLQKVDLPMSNRKENCWIWTGALKHNQYGKTTILYEIIKGQIPAHRASYIFFKGIILPQTYLVRHMCHNPRCVNPHHLTIGTQKENMEDSIKAERMYVGGSNPNCKITELEVINLRKDRVFKQMSLSQLGEKYGLAKPTVSQIVNYKNWSYPSIMEKCRELGLID